MRRVSMGLVRVVRVMRVWCVGVGLVRVVRVVWVMRVMRVVGMVPMVDQPPAAMRRSLHGHVAHLSSPALAVGVISTFLRARCTAPLLMQFTAQANVDDGHVVERHFEATVAAHSELQGIERVCRERCQVCLNCVGPLGSCRPCRVVHNCAQGAQQCNALHCQELCGPDFRGRVALPHLDCNSRRSQLWWRVHGGWIVWRCPRDELHGIQNSRIKGAPDCPQMVRLRSRPHRRMPGLQDAGRGRGWRHMIVSEANELSHWLRIVVVSARKGPFETDELSFPASGGFGKEGTKA